MSRVGIMQGRLSPPGGATIQSFPKSSWREEFLRAKELGLGCIEWIFEQDEWKKNPIATKEGLFEIHEIIREFGVPVVSVCADYFLDVPYLTAPSNQRKELQEMLEWLVVQSAQIGATYVDLPFVDASEISSPRQFREVIEFASPGLKRASSLGVTIALETALDPGSFRELLLQFNNPSLMANYDTGNSASLGYNSVEELHSYGRWIRTVHIKDRILRGGTVPLGTGNADFPSFFRELAGLKYVGPLILQTAREAGEVETAMKNKEFVERFLEKGSN